MSEFNNTTIRVSVIDESEEFLAVVREWISQRPGLELVGTANTTSAGLELVKKVRPDLVLVEALMPSKNGLVATGELKSLEAPPRVFVLSIYDNEMLRSGATAAGADAFVSKADFNERMPQLLSALFDGLVA
jgi:DNA-binding NarL/FixJ family response regulator